MQQPPQGQSTFQDSNTHEGRTEGLSLGAPLIANLILQQSSQKYRHRQPPWAQSIFGLVEATNRVKREPSKARSPGRRSGGKSAMSIDVQFLVLFTEDSEVPNILDAHYAVFVTVKLTLVMS